jgi:hypothetical protein
MANTSTRESQAFYPGQLVLQRATGEIAEIVFLDAGARDYLLSNGRWVGPDEIEDPLHAGRQRDLRRDHRKAEHGPSAWALFLALAASASVGALAAHLL